MFDAIAGQAPRFDTTFLPKSGSYPGVREAGEMRLYKLAWYLHLREVALRVSARGDKVFVVAGTFGTRNRRTQAEAAIADVCDQVDRDITLCVWEAATSWGLQVADYALWAVHRDLLGRYCPWFATAIQPSLASTFTPWGLLPVTPTLPTS